MIKLKAPLNYRGTLIEKGSVVGYFSKELEENLIKAGFAERVDSNALIEERSPDKTIDKTTKAKQKKDDNDGFQKSDKG